MADLYSTELRDIVRGAVRRSQRRLRGSAPTLARHALTWQRTLAGGAEPEAYFLHPEAFPMVLLPWWLESTIHELRRGPSSATSCTRPSAATTSCG